MKTIQKSCVITAPVEFVWKAFVDPHEIDAWGGGPAVMDDNEGTAFSLWGGDIYGKNIEVVINKKLVQEWYGGDWAEASRVTFTFASEGNKTQVELLQENVPDSEAKDIDSGWDDYYIGQIKAYLEE
jgi:activator of HSP90 ATPase